MNTEIIHHVHLAVKKRKSIVSFSGQEIEDEDLRLLFEAARWAPSSYNQQPWRFIIAKKEEREEFQTFVDLLSEGNRSWAPSAPVLVLSLAEVVNEYNNKINRFAFHDLGIAVGNLLFQATSMGLGVHLMGGYDVEKAKTVLNIPDNFEPAAMMAIGYQGEIDHLPVELKRRELAKRTRKEVDEIVYTAKWGRGLW